MKKSQRIPLPDGASIDDYKGWEEWDYRRWAWEYLRRNLSFRAACADVSAIKNSAERRARKAETAERFMLKRYRDCDAPCETQKPAFQAIKPSPLPQSIGATEWSTALRHDQVAIVFNLRPALHAKNAIGAMVANAEKCLQKYLENLKGFEKDCKQHPQSQLGRTQHLRNLRLLDATAVGHDPIDIARLPWWREYTKKGQPKTLEADAIRKAVRSARDLTEFGYTAIFSSPKRLERMPVRPKEQDSK